MNFEDLWTIAPKIIPLLPKLEKAAQTFQKLAADPDVKDAIQTIIDVAETLKAPPPVT